MEIYRQIIGTLVRHPTLVPAALGLAWRTRSRGWYRRPPFLPLPDRRYLEWRMETAYGDKDHRPTPDEVVRYLRWTSRMQRLTRAGRL